MSDGINIEFRHNGQPVKIDSITHYTLTNIFTQLYLRAFAMNSARVSG